MTPSPVVRVMLAVGMGVVWSVAYSWTNRMGAKSARATVWPSPLERWPWLYVPELAVIYFGVGLVLPAIPLFVPSDRQSLLRTSCAYSIIGGVCLLTYLTMPVRMVRPAYDRGRFGEGIMRFVTSVDDPANCLPSSHTAFAVAAACLLTVGGASPGWQWAGWIGAILVAISTVTVAQHYLVDALAGAVLAGVGVWLANRFFPAGGA